MTIPRERTTHRLAVVVMASQDTDLVLDDLAAQLDPDRATALVRARIADMVSGVIRLDGVNLSVAAQRGEVPSLSRLVLSGFDTIETTAPITSPAAIAQVIREMLDRRFERVAVLLPRSVPLPARIVATALGVATKVDITLGPTPGGRVYLLAARDERGPALLDNLDQMSVDRVRDIAAEMGLTVGMAEPRRLMTDFADVAALHTFVDANTADCPEMWQWFSSQPEPSSTI